MVKFVKEWFSRKTNRGIAVFLCIMLISMILSDVTRMTAEPVGPEMLVVQNVEKRNPNQEPSDLILTFEDGRKLLFNRAGFDIEEMEAFAERLQPGTAVQVTWLADGGVYDRIIGLELDGEMVLDAETILPALRQGTKTGLMMMPLWAMFMFGIVILAPRLSSLKSRLTAGNKPL